MPSKLDYNPNKICCIEGCENFVARVDWCRRHYRLKRVYGDPEYDTQIRYKTRVDDRTEKKCLTCKNILPMDNFALAGKRENGSIRRNAHCKSCAKGIWLEYTYGLKADDIENLLVKQNHRCPICLKDLIKFHVDHDHSCCPGTNTCGKCIRGLLCPGCNAAIGILKEDPEIFARAVSYLRRNNGASIPT